MEKCILNRNVHKILGKNLGIILRNSGHILREYLENFEEILGIFYTRCLRNSTQISYEIFQGNFGKKNNQSWKILSAF